MGRSITAVGLIVIAGAWMTCAAAASPGADRAVLDGTWGGRRAKLIASPAEARLQIDCLAGRADVPIVLDADGAFRVDLRLTPIRGVQIEGDAEQGVQAHVSGRVTSNGMRITVGPPDVTGAGSYDLTRDGKAVLPNCRLRS